MATTTLATHEFRAMGTEVALVAPWREGIERRFRMAEHWVHAYEGRMSRFIPYSELSRLNAAAGKPVRVSPLLFAFIERCLALRERSGGLFDPAVLHALEAAGYDRTFDEVGQGGVAAGMPATAAGARAEAAAIHLDADTRTVTLPAGVGIESGGLGKGWAADRVARYLGSPCLVDAGGDIRVAGSPDGHGGWLVGVQDPYRPEEDLALIEVRDAGIATSSVLKRRWQTSQGAAHHLIDPRIGAPAATDAVAVTVIASDATMADYHAKVALLLGRDGGLAYIEREARLEGLVVSADGAACASSGWNRYLAA